MGATRSTAFPLRSGPTQGSQLVIKTVLSIWDFILKNLFYTRHFKII